jgi:hypothetical protein
MLHGDLNAFDMFNSFHDTVEWGKHRGVLGALKLCATRLSIDHNNAYGLTQL